MRQIDFFIAGVQKSGTTTLYDLLSQDSRIFLPSIKENPFFTNPEIQTDFLERLYTDYKSEDLIGGAYANAIFFEDSAKELVNNNNDIKIIIILRNPTDRAYSAYNYSYRLGIEKCNSFEEALENDMRNNYTNYIDIANRTYLKHGHYYNQITAYTNHIPIEKVHCILFDDLIKDEIGVLKRLYKFLELDYKHNISHVKSNVSSVVKIKWIHKLIFDKNILKSIYQKFMPAKFQYLINHKIVKRIERINKKNTPYNPMNIETRERLIKYYSSHNKKLEELLKIDLKSWNK
tara:strand:+ start:68284 stop:69153 length:870 start_codon:yes stop_codon:yes gene_type:complete